MTDPGVRELLDELASAVAPSDLTEIGWLDGRRRRTRRRALVATGAVAAVVTVVTLTWATTPSPGNPPVGGTPTPSAGPTGSAVPGRILVAPARADEPALPWRSTPLPPDLTAPATPTRLSADPVARALALIETTDPPSSHGIEVIGADGRPRSIDSVNLQMVPDGAGNQSYPLRAGSLAPDGTKAAFPQHDAIVIVDLTTGLARRLALPGFNEDVQWSPDSNLVIVTRSAGGVVLDASAGTSKPLTGSTGAGIAFLDSTRLVELPASATEQTSVRIRRTLTSQAEFVASINDFAGWWGQPFVTGQLVARSSFSAGLQVEGIATSNPQLITVLDTATPTDRRVLALDWTGRNKGCCPVLGWLDTDTVLFLSDGGGTATRILAWDVERRTVQRVSELPAQTLVSLAALG